MRNIIFVLGKYLRILGRKATFLVISVFVFGNINSIAQSFSSSKELSFNQSKVSLDDAVDSLRQSVLNRKNDFETTSKQLLKLAKKNKDFYNAGRIHNYISHWHYLNNTKYHSDSIIFHSEKAVANYMKSGNLDAVHETYLGLAMDYLNNNESKKSEEANLKAAYYFEKTDNELGLAESQVQIAALYLSTKEPAKVIEYATLSYPSLLKNEEYLSAASALWYISEAYKMLKDYTKAMEFVDQSIAFSSTRDFEQNESLLVASYETKGDIYVDQGMLDKALFYYKKAWEDNIALDGKENGDFFRYNIGKILFLQQKYKEALPHLIAGIKGKEHSKIDRASELYLTLSQCYEKLGDYPKAIEFRDKASEYETELTQAKIEQLQSEMIVKYETEKKDEAIAAQEKLLTQKNRVQYLIIGVVGILLVFLFTLLYFFRKNKKASTMIFQKNAENELLLREIHHRVKNNLEMVKGLISLQSAQLQDSAAKDAMIASQNRVQSMGIIHQKLYQGDNLGSIEMKDYFLNLGEGVLDSFGKEEKVKIECAMSNLDLDVDTAVPIGLIVNELLTNTLKYAFPNNEKGVIKIGLSKTNNGTLSLIFTDNGVGKEKDVASKGTGFGTQLIQLLTQQLNGNMEESHDLGTSYIFHFKLSTAA
ncbi:tetratricopeptide repeat-containing sensor histidine kinase [Patiriisocius marinus]|uniref:histidine kinase n=1 Tax=Patiriisocius marinus TaxID=1397112 RepID=A0A5J4IW48_9FLAO|nr:histidine kinase dimerization/phosphoacceptor domain -containing protein [Patiriisocius marinus]GER58552.1 hypothetical protein ULMA_06600 [Patiriisocius marinus]